MVYPCLLYTSTDLQKAKAKVAKGGDNPHPALRTAYTSDIQVDETFAKINKELTEKWFENGDLKLTPTRRTGVNGCLLYTSRCV